MIAHDDLKVNRICYKFIEKEIQALFSTNRIENLYAYKRETEKSFAKYAGSEYAYFVDSGTTTFYLALELANIGEGDEVIVPILSWPTVIAAVLSKKSTPKFIDIKEDCTLDETKIIITPKTKCIIPVHMYGHAASVIKIKEILKPNMTIIEDCCQAHGTRIHEKMVGSFGEYGAFSFDPYKTISSLGTGGALTYKKKEDIERIREMIEIEKDNPLVLKLNRTPAGMSYTDMATLKVRLKLAQLIEKKKIACVEQYEKRLGDTPVCLIKDPKDVISVRQNYIIYALKRDMLIKFLIEEGIICKEPYLSINKMPLFEKYTKDQQFPNAERYCKEAIILPLFSLMEPKEVDVVCDKIIEFYKK